MLKSILKRRVPNTEGALAGSPVKGFSIIRATLADRSIIAFEKRGGQATALEVTDRGAEILRGLAAGAVVSELEDALHHEALDEAASKPRAWEASREETEAFIQSLELLDMVEKQALANALPR